MAPGHEGAVVEEHDVTRAEGEGMVDASPIQAATTPVSTTPVNAPPAKRSLTKTEKDLAELDNTYTYHAPHGDQQQRYENIRAHAKHFATIVLGACPASRERSLALTSIQQATQMANAAIAIHEAVTPVINPVTPDPSEHARQVERIAQACHEANRLYCQSIGDDSQPTWEHAPEWQRSSARNGVELILDNPSTTPAECHASWLQQKTVDGWTYGERKDPVLRTHPCFVPYDALPAEQRAKNAIFGSIVRALAGN